MFFSKSFGYAVRSILYIASVQKQQQYVQLDEISNELGLPRQFIGRVLKNLVKQNVLLSNKGPSGGFSISKENLQLNLLTISQITDSNSLDQCIVKSCNCTDTDPCPVHTRFEKAREEVKQFLMGTTIAELMKGNKAALLKSLSEHNLRQRKL